MFGRREQHYIRIGPHLIHRRFGNEHLQIVGSTGSGKTRTMVAHMESVITAPLPMHAIVYDPKAEFLPIIYKFVGDTEASVKSGDSRIKSLDILDQRGYAWDLAKDIDSPISARELATILVPQTGERHEGQSFFDSAVRDILYGVQLAFMNSDARNKSWSFRDLILASLHEPYTRALFDSAIHAGAKGAMEISRIKEAYLDCDPRVASNIRATLSTRLSIFEPVAACWHAASNKGRIVSLNEWAADGCNDILILGNNETGRVSYEAINRAVFARGSQIILSRPEMNSHERETGANQTWIWLDEVREAGNLNRALSDLLLMGRSKNVCIVLAYQDFEGLVDVYGESIAIELTGQCNNSVYLRTVSEATAKRCAEAFGSGIQLNRSYGTSTGDSTTYSNNKSEEIRSFLTSSDLIYLHLASKKGGITGYYRLAGYRPTSAEEALGIYKPEEFKFSLSKWLRQLLRKTPEKADSPWLSARMPRPITDQYLQPWDADDWRRLGFTGDPPSWRKNSLAIGRSVSDLMQEYLDSKEPSEQDDGSN